MDFFGMLLERTMSSSSGGSDENVWLELTESKTTANSFFKGMTAKKLPKTNFINATDFYHFCMSANVEEIDYYINSCKGTGFAEAFYYCSAKTIKGVNVENATHVNNMFRSASVETIDTPLNFSKVTNFGTPFWQCSTIKNISFVKDSIHYSFPIAHSSRLTAESIQSLINGLAYVDTTQTLSLHSTVGANLTDEQLTTIANKNWTVG